MSTPLLEHQATALSWLMRQPRAILADEMGLVKTAVILALVCSLSRSAQDKPCLIVVPKSLMLNWEAEMRKLINPEHMLRYIMIRSNAEAETLTHQTLRSYDIVLTTKGAILGQWKRVLAAFGDGLGQRQEASPNGWPQDLHGSLLHVRIHQTSNNVI